MEATEGAHGTAARRTTAEPVVNGLRVGRVIGVPVYLRTSWFVVALLITVVFGSRLSGRDSMATGYLIAFCYAVLLLFSVFAHELAHAVAARATGSPASHIVLDLWGGHTVFARPAAGPWQSILVAASGPLANLALAVAAVPLASAADPDGVPGRLLAATIYANLVVAVFNSLPGLPLDGGRVLEGLIWAVWRDRRLGTLVAGWSGRVVALGVLVMAFWGLIRGSGSFSSIWLLAIAAILWQGAGQAIWYAGWQRRAELLQVGRLMRPAAAVPSGATVADADAALQGLRNTAPAAYAAPGAAPGSTGPQLSPEPGARPVDARVVLLDVYGLPTAVLDQQAAAAVPAGRRDQVPLAAVSESLATGAVTPIGLGGRDLLAHLDATPAARYAVVDGAGRVVGVLESRDVAGAVTGPPRRWPGRRP